MQKKRKPEVPNVGDLVSVCGPASASLVQDVCQAQLADATVVSRPEECEGLPIPESWKQLLQAQRDCQPIPWDVVWHPAKSWFPAVRQFIIKKCCGISVITQGIYSLSLAYVFVDTNHNGRLSLGELPAGKELPANNLSNHCPASFKSFYQFVHNGFRDNNRCGIEPLGKLTLSDIVSERDVFGTSTKRPFVLQEMVQVYTSLSGDDICVDLKRSNSQRLIGGTYWHETPLDSVFNENVKPLINRRFEASMGLVLDCEK